MKTKTIAFVAVLIGLLPVLFSAGNGGCTRSSAKYENLPVTEVTVQNVVLDPDTMSPVVVLQDLDGKVSMPIWIGANEALAIASMIENVEYPRPMTHDLIKNILSEVHTPVIKVVITELVEQTFFAVILLRYKGNEIAVDARPSDAIAIALRVNAPIFVSTALFKSRGTREGTKEL